MLYKLIFSFIFVLPFFAAAQSNAERNKALRKERRQELKEFSKLADTSYYIPYHSQITGRLYLSRKTTSFSIKHISHNTDLNYKPNSTLNLGIGGTYKWITVNLAYGFSFLNFLNPKTELGKTKYLDLQCHLYGRKIIIDGFGQFYKGFYSSPRGSANAGDSYYLRPDVRINQVGLSMQYVINNRKFSYRASFLQNEWQKKSAGAILLGFESYAGNVIGDSSIVPRGLDSSIAKKNIREFVYYKTGPNLGCAYTLVYKKHFFVTGSLAGNLGFGNNTIISDEGRNNNFGFSTSVFVRVFAGYNSNKWAISAIYTSDQVGVNHGDLATRMTLTTTNVRLNLVYRFPAPKRIKKHLDVLDKTREDIEQKIHYDQLK
ncbi:MAG: hypothetical protein JWO58_1363 [Chitinophagaceae bacterium]|nr:hypothetical protein [Chitinophagaceae bacterium]